MPLFLPGESKVAAVPVIVKPAGLHCQSEVYLGPDDQTRVARSGIVLFTSEGIAQIVRHPINMPAAGEYYVFVDIDAEGTPIARLIGEEIVSIIRAIDLNTMLILKAGGRSFSEVGSDALYPPYNAYGVLESPLVQARLSGVSIEWKNIGIVPTFWEWDYDAWERWDWWMSFLPQFDSRQWMEPEEEGQEGEWWEPPMPTYMARPIYSYGNVPPIGSLGTVNITGLHSGGWTGLPGLYDGIFFLQQVYRGWDVAPRIYWRIKNLIQVTG